MANNFTTCCAGEHFVAYKLSALGYLVALTKSGSPSVDLMVSSLDGQKTVTIQVKTGNAPHTTYKRNLSKQHWAWRVGEKAKEIHGESVFYVFVDLKTQKETSAKHADQPMPAVFIVPARVVATHYRAYREQPKKKQTGFWFALGTEEADSWKPANWKDYNEALDLIKKRLA
jgi:hypothetical protein